MLSASNFDVVEALRAFKERGFNVTFLVPTPTGLNKSIMDATEEVRGFLASTGAHNFDEQQQGTDHKKQLRTLLICADEIVEVLTSLYRPETKNGDPRIWIGSLKKYAKAGDLIALGYARGRLLAINCSSLVLESFLSEADSPIQEFRLQPSTSPVFEELLEKLQDISFKGFVPTLRPGDTGIGYTLETLLGIEANSSKKPDYKGIELKATRERTAKTGQSTIFSQVPNWKISRLKGSREILEERGQYNVEKERHQLYHEISSRAPNSYGMQLEVRDESLDQVYVPDSGKIVEDVTWMLQKLKDRMLEKHKETVWITAQTNGKGKKEEFWYKSAKRAQGVDPNVIPILLESGAITVHYLIKETLTGGAKDQGYLFKTSTKNLDLLFASIEKYDLSS